MSKKLIALALAGVFAFTFSVKAVTVEELQAQIQSLLAQITQLQQQLAAAQGGATTGLCLSADLKYGMKGDAVKTLQQGLKQDPSVYPEGLVTGYFGPLTKAAVIRFQEKYASEILAPWGLTKGTGYVGSTTRAKFNALYCTPATTTTTTAPAETTTTTTTTTVPPTEGSLTVTWNPIPGSGTVTVYGGNTNKEVAAIKVKATNSDVTVKRIDWQFGTSSGFPWTDLSKIALYDGDTLIKEVDAVQSNFTEVTFATTYTLRMDGLNIPVTKDTTKVLSLKVTAISSPTYAGTITVLVPSNGVRGVDTAGLNVYAPSAALTAHSFTTSAAQAPTITVTANVDNPLSQNVIGYTNSTTRVDLLKFDVKVENVGMTFKGGALTVTDANSQLTAVELYDGSTVLASASVSGSGTVSWSTYNLPISAGTTKTLTVKGVVKASPTAGASFSVSIPATTGLTGVDDNGTARNNGTQTVSGHTMYVYTVAPTFAYVSSSVEVRGTNATTHPQDIGDTSIVFSVTAHGGDIYIPDDTTSATAIYETLTGGTATTTTSTTWSCSSPAEDTTASGYWRIPAGQTAQCTFSTLVTNTDGTAGYFKVAVGGIMWNTSATTTSAVTQTWGLTNLETADFYLGN